jgi:hypothetical protein
MRVRQPILMVPNFKFCKGSLVELQSQIKGRSAYAVLMVTLLRSGPNLVRGKVSCMSVRCQRPWKICIK